MRQSEKIIFRVTTEQKAFVKEFAEKTGMDTSEFLRTIIQYYFMAYFSKSGSYEEIRKRFFAMNPKKSKGLKSEK